MVTELAAKTAIEVVLYLRHNQGYGLYPPFSQPLSAHNEQSQASKHFKVTQTCVVDHTFVLAAVRLFGDVLGFEGSGRVGCPKG